MTTTGAMRPRSFTPIECAVAVHLVVFFVGVSWAFGGNADWVRTPISIWGSIGICLTGVIATRQMGRRDNLRGPLAWIWPIAVLNDLVFVSALTPGFRVLTSGSGPLMMPLSIAWWKPSSARADVTLRSLWLFDGIYFSCINIALAVRHRRVIRSVLAILVGNALVLAVFGTVQKLVGATGIYFGAVKSPQTLFFASFVYDNHWGAFIVLMLGACTGLIIEYAHGRNGEGFFRGPGFFGTVAGVLMAISVPLSGSRACTLLLCILSGVALVRGIPEILRALRNSGIKPAIASAGLTIAAILAAAGAWEVAGGVIQDRANKTREQVATMWAQGGIGSRSVLYHDTWRMAQPRLLFGWGMGSFPIVFRLFNTQENKVDRIPIVYHDAHSDWLQSVAELGLVGTSLIGVAVALPALAARRSRVTALPFFLLCGCALTAIYAWIEFPFGNVAVVLGWWLCFIGAVQYVRLTDPPPKPPAQAGSRNPS